MRSNRCPKTEFSSKQEFSNSILCYLGSCGWAFWLTVFKLNAWDSMFGLHFDWYWCRTWSVSNCSKTISAYSVSFSIFSASNCSFLKMKTFFFPVRLPQCSSPTILGSLSLTDSFRILDMMRANFIVHAYWLIQAFFAKFATMICGSKTKPGTIDAWATLLYLAFA